MYVMIDNYDSFVHNLAAYFEELGQEVLIIRSNEVSFDELKQLEQGKILDGIIISPGPKSPRECAVSGKVVTTMAESVPILGVCLGHQIIGYTFGAKVKRGKRPMHGKVTPISHSRNGLFVNLPGSYEVTRYHSLVVCEEGLPGCLQIDARAEDDIIMALSHRYLPIYGVQFHPEAILTQYGHALMENYIKICMKWREKNENIC